MKDKSIKATMKLLEEKRKHMNDPLNIAWDEFKRKLIRQGKIN